MNQSTQPQACGYSIDAAPQAQQPGAPSQQRSDLVPGVMHCAKCKFQLNRVTLCVSDGNAYAGDSKTEPCPNGCGPLWPVTWEQEARNGWKALEEMHDRLQTAARAGASPEDERAAFETWWAQSGFAKFKDTAFAGWEARSGAQAAPSDAEILNRSGCIDYSPGTAEYDLELIRWYRRQMGAPAAVSAPSVPKPWPETPAEVRSFIGNNFEKLQYGREDQSPHDDDRYTLTAHDLLSAIRWWTADEGAVPALPSVPEGWRLVPVEPTRKMRAAANAWTDAPCSAWHAMLAAAPQAPAQEVAHG